MKAKPQRQTSEGQQDFLVDLDQENLQSKFKNQNSKLILTAGNETFSCTSQKKRLHRSPKMTRICLRRKNSLMKSSKFEPRNA